MTDDGNFAGNTVVLIGGRAQREFDVLHQLGCRILYLDRRVPLHCMARADVPLEVDVDDWALVGKTISEHLNGSPPAAVLTHVEPRIPLMAHLAGELLPENRGLNVQAAWNCRDKWQTRTMLAEAGFPVPRFGVAENADRAARMAGGIGFPVVVKPRDGAGAFGVRRCGVADDVRHAAAAILDDPGPGVLPGVLVEEYLDGPEYAVQTLTRDGRTEVLSVFRQHMTRPPVFAELGYDHPCGLLPPDRASLEQTVGAVLEALGIRDWVSHTQVRLVRGGFRVVEVNARRPGGRLVEMTEAVSGVDMTLAASQLALGLPVTVGQPAASHARYSSVVFEETGVVSYRQGVDFRGGVPPVVEMDVSPGERVLPVDHPEGGVYGRIIVFGDSADELHESERRVRDALSLQLAPMEGLTWAGSDSREFKSCC